MSDSRDYTVVEGGNNAIITCDPCNGYIWTIAYNLVATLDGMYTAVVTQKYEDRTVNTFIETRPTPDCLAAWLRKVLPAELLR
jgi:hypothetical protein